MGNKNSTFFRKYNSLEELYKKSLNENFQGVGIVNYKYNINSLDRDISKITNYFGDNTFGKIREIKVNKKQSHSIAETIGCHPLHTDATFSNEILERFILSFVEVCKEKDSGTSLFFPVEWILNEIPDKLRKALETSIVSYTRNSGIEGNKRYKGTILSYNLNSKLIFRWRYDDIVKPKIIDSKNLPIEQAIKWIYDFIQNTEPLKYSAKKGDTLLIDNCKILHGRTHLKPETNRLALRAWIR